MPLPSIVTGCFIGLRFRIEQLFFGEPAIAPERLQLKSVDFRALRRQIRGYGVGQREIDVIPAQQNVLADRDTLELKFPVLLGDGDSVKSVVPPPISTTSTRSPY